MEFFFRKSFLELVVNRRLYALADFDVHLRAALEWTRSASQALGGNGISKGYDLLRGTWLPAYPEITGYSLPTLINASRLLGEREWRELALAQGDFLFNSSDPDGGVNYWKKGRKSMPIIFDTGQVIFGWLALYRETNEDRFLDAAVKSGDWLVQKQDPGGLWVKHQHLNVPKVIDTRVAWALLELHRVVNKTTYARAAEMNLEWAIQHQNADGWFRKCAFSPLEDPFTHTIAYTAESFFACGSILGEERYLKASQRAADRLLELQRKDGSLPSTFGAGWVETDSSSCLTGNVQMSILWLRLGVLMNRPEYFQAGRNALEFVCRNQSLDSTTPGIRGGIPGSYPIYGKYERLKYPGWAAKFFINALLEYKALESNRLHEMLPG